MELVYSTVYLEEVKEKNMEYYYMTMKKNLDGVEVEKIFIWKEGYAFKRNETKNMHQNLKPYKDAYSLLTKWKSQEHQKIIILVYLG